MSNACNPTSGRLNDQQILQNLLWGAQEWEIMHRQYQGGGRVYDRCVFDTPVLLCNSDSPADEYRPFEKHCITKVRLSSNTFLLIKTKPFHFKNHITDAMFRIT